MTLNERIDTSLQEWGETPCFIECDSKGSCVTISAPELRRRIQERTKLFARWGIRENFMVPIFLINSIDFIESFVALLNLRAVPVMVKLEFRHLELVEIFQNCRPQAIITESTHLPLLKPFLSGMIVIERSSAGFQMIQTQRKHRHLNQIPDDIATVNYTYRGYGYPLGALIPHRQYLHGSETLQAGLQGRPGEKMLITIPMSHIFSLVGCITVPLLYKMTGVIVQTIHPRFIFRIISDFAIEYLTSVPHIYLLLLRLKDKYPVLNSLRAFVSGGSVLTDEQFRLISLGFGVELLHGYGLTECTPVSRNVRGKSRGGTVGPVCDHIECRIDNRSGGDTGEIFIKTPNMSKGYLNRARETQEAFEGEWFKTGDRGYFQGNHLVFSEEIKKTRKINGNIVDLSEIRNAILLDDQIVEVDIHYKDNSLFAHCLTSQTVESSSKSKELSTALRGLLAAYKIPRISLNAL